MKKPIIFMFSGQGSHYYQMGRELYEENSIFQYHMQKVNTLYQDLTGLSLLAELYHSSHTKGDPFTRTLLTHPAIFMVEYALANTLLKENIIPDFVLGASLGEFTAAVISGVLPFEVALTATVKQAQLIEEKSEPGNMLAILESSSLYDQYPLLRENTELASVNFPGHFVVSGKLKNIQEIEKFLKTENFSCQTLNVSHGFHSHCIDKAAFDYLQFINQYSLKDPTIPFISCAYAKNLYSLLPSHFWKIARELIQFQLTIENLEKQNNYTYIDVGPSGTLATLVKYNLKSTSRSKALTTLTPFSSSAFSFKGLKEAINS